MDDSTYFSIRWEKVVPEKNKRYEPHIIHVRTTFLDATGKVLQVTRQYEEWLGVCTNRIDKVVEALNKHFPNCQVRYVPMGTRRKVLPYFPKRLETGKLDSPSKPFYKVFIRACHEEVGRFLKKFKISYYDKQDWLVRLYIDLCKDTRGFYYKWYSITDSPWLLESFHLHSEYTHAPDWTIAAFDLETVPMDGANRVPTGLDETDEIVMISLYKWNSKGVQQFLFYRSPAGPVDLEHGIYYTSEKSMLNDFHVAIQDCQVLTGYNINGFDVPCLFSRLLWLRMHSVLQHYSSAQVGQTLVTTFQNKLVLDLYHYFKTFSSYDLPGFKLDDVARIKLGETKIPIQSTGIWCWYTHPEASSVMEASVEECHRVLKPHRVPVGQFGTFRRYLEYCLKDSLLVKRLFDKEMVLSFVVERANFTALNAVQALYMGNSNFLLELLKTYGNVLGFFINTRFFSSPIDAKKYESMFITKTYQGALNWCTEETPYEDVSVMDFASMYPSALLSSNLCYSSCTIMTRDEWVACPRAQSLTTIPYRVHSQRDFETNEFGDVFRYPDFDPDKDTFAIVINEGTEAFLPCVVKHFIQLRKHHQATYKETKDVYHYNVQLCIKILINSLYGIMANKNSCLAYPPIAITIVTLARYQLLGSYHYMSKLGYKVCYADTDSLMVHRWPHDHCHAVNAYLNLPHVELKFEQRMRRLLVLSRKRYVYETQKGEIVTKGFQKRINELLETITRLVLDNVWSFIYQTPRPDVVGAWLEDNLSLESCGWLLWVHVLQLALYKCRDAKKYSICRKTKPLSEYKSKTCATVRMLQKYPEKANDYIEYTHSRADVAVKEATQWIVDAQDCQWVNYEKLILSQKKMFCLLLNMAFWKRPKIPIELCDMVMNAIRWKQFMHAELLHWHKTGRHIEMLVETGTKYTFSINNHTQRTTRRLVRRKLVDGDITEKAKKRKVTMVKKRNVLQTK